MTGHGMYLPLKVHLEREVENHLVVNIELGLKISAFQTKRRKR